ncbi:sodium-dependent transporter, partial [Halomonas marinisediminis]
MFVMIIILVVNALQLPNAHLGLEFYLLPKFSALTPEAILAAIGLAFFTLGIGVGNMVAYGSYMGKDQAITSSSIYIILGNLLIAFLMGLIIFPSVFSFGI